MVIMGVGAVAAFLLRPPQKIIRDDGTVVATIKARGFVEELKANLEIFKDWKLLIMVGFDPNLYFPYPLFVLSASMYLIDISSTSRCKHIIRTDYFRQIPAFLPAETFLVYGGSVNAFHNNLRARCLLSFMAVVLQIPAGYGLQLILDHKKCRSPTYHPDFIR